MRVPLGVRNRADTAPAEEDDEEPSNNSEDDETVLKLLVAGEALLCDSGSNLLRFESVNEKSKEIRRGDYSVRMSDLIMYTASQRIHHSIQA